MDCQTLRRMHSALLGQTTGVRTIFNGMTDMPLTPKPHIRMATIFPVASVLSLILVLFPATGSAETIVVFSASGTPTGTISGNTVSGVNFNTININAGAGILVNSFVEAYSNGALTFSVIGSGNLGGIFSNVSGQFITINEPPPTFGTNPASDSLFTSVNSLGVSAAFLGDLGLPANAGLDPAATVITASTQANGTVFSTSDELGFAGTAPEPSTVSMLALGLFGVLVARVRRKKVKST